MTAAEPGTHTGGRASFEAEMARDEERMRSAGADEDTSGQAGPGWQPHRDATTRTIRGPGATSEDAAPFVVSLSPEFLAQVFAQTTGEVRTAEEFDEAARAYQRLQAGSQATAIIDLPGRIDFDA